VRIGFERWGQAVAENVPDTPEQYLQIGGKRTLLTEGQWVKLANGLAVQLGGEPAKNTTWLVLDRGSVPDFASMPNRTVMDKMPDAAGVAELEKANRIVAVKKARMADYMRHYDVTLMNPKVLVGLFIGAMSTFVFCALTMKAVGRAAKGMVEEVRRQFREKPGIMQGTETPDYAAPVEISTKAAQKEMVLPSLLALVLPVVGGIVLGVGGVMGILVGGLTTGFCVAVFMANAGGAWDNAKKHIEGGVHGGKGTEAHKAAVVGDTVGDPFKDTSGPSLNILVKLMSMVSVVVAGLVVRYSLEALGIF
jgi:inorganic pyrophosphatase/K(+)-stimulated pyrophosphate-energized sodium pump